MESYPKDKAKGSWVALLLPPGPHQVKAKGPINTWRGAEVP